MSTSPAALLRAGFSVLAIVGAAGVWLGLSDRLGWAAIPIAGVLFLVLAGIGDWLFRRLASDKERRADLEQRARSE